MANWRNGITRKWKKKKKFNSSNLYFLNRLQETTGRVAWRLSRSWPPWKACASPTRTRSTATPGRSTTTAFWGNYGSASPKLAWWCASARAWPSEVSWWPWGDWGCSGSSSSSAGMDAFLFTLESRSRAPPTHPPSVDGEKSVGKGWKAARCSVVFLMCMSPRQPRKN